MTKIAANNNVLFIFRRDLRIEDNAALNSALSSGHPVITAFILDPRQFEPHPYQSIPGKQFLLESLNNLAHELVRAGGRLNLIYGKAEELIPKLMKKYSCSTLYANRDYTPFSRERDKLITEQLKGISLNFIQVDDALLNAPGVVLKDDGKPYTVFTPYYRKALSKVFSSPTKRPKGKFSDVTIEQSLSLESIGLGTTFTNEGRLLGGRTEGLKILERISQFDNYDINRDLPALSATTHLSAHHKFGTVSIRESAEHIIKAFGKESTLLKELYWRDFFTQIAFYFPHVFQGAFNKNYDTVEWEENPKRFNAWCTGMTGFPIVDAGMRELNETGYMHNRVRMIVASFLTKDLQIHWRKGEQYFAQHLVDYDPAVNNGNWQWAASTGCDAQPYFRIFNPWLQQKKFDPDCIYIKKWIPELRQLTSKAIHSLEDETPTLILNGYPAPIVDHAHEKRNAIERFSAALKK